MSVCHSARDDATQRDGREAYVPSRPPRFDRRTGPPRDEASSPVPPPELNAPARDEYQPAGSCAELFLGGRGNFRCLGHLGCLTLGRSILREIHGGLGLQHCQLS
jgi:hypothetical protein